MRKIKRYPPRPAKGRALLSAINTERLRDLVQEAEERARHPQPHPFLPKQPPLARGPAELLEEAAETFRSRTPFYGDSYKKTGKVIDALLDGMALKEFGPLETQRLFLVMKIADKLHRYCTQLNSGGHKDSAHDMMVYAAMLEELTKS